MLPCLSVSVCERDAERLTRGRLLNSARRQNSSANSGRECMAASQNWLASDRERRLGQPMVTAPHAG